MKYFLILILFVTSIFSSQAQVFTSGADENQVEDPVSWDVKLEKQNDSIYKLIINAKIEKGWHLYPQNI